MEPGSLGPFHDQLNCTIRIGYTSVFTLDLYEPGRIESDPSDVCVFRFHRIFFSIEKKCAK